MTDWYYTSTEGGPWIPWPDGVVRPRISVLDGNTWNCCGHESGTPEVIHSLLSPAEFRWDVVNGYTAGGPRCHAS